MAGKMNKGAHLNLPQKSGTKATARTKSQNNGNQWKDMGVKEMGKQPDISGYFINNVIGN